MSLNSEFDFDTTIERKNTSSNKWDDVEKLFGAPDVLPMWVADMDFSAPPCVQKALSDRVAHGVYGYASPRDSYRDALRGWLERRHDYVVERDAIVYCSGVVPALSLLIQALSEPGDPVLIQPPVYPPFAAMIGRNGRRVVENPLVVRDGGYQMDLVDFERKVVEEGIRLFILCSPHNPVGRVWTRAELTALGEICLRHGVFVVSDEIHADLILPGFQHTPFAAINPDFAAVSATCVAPSKTFNLAGLQTAFTIIADAKARAAYQRCSDRYGSNTPNVFGLVAAQTVFEQGDAWLDALLVYLGQGAQQIDAFLRQAAPQLTWIQPEGTYLGWLDCRQLELSHEDLGAFFQKQAKVGLNNGHVFGKGGDGFMRLNFGCPHSTLSDGLTRIEQALAAR